MLLSQYMPIYPIFHGTIPARLPAVMCPVRLHYPEALAAPESVHAVRLLRNVVSKVVYIYVDSTSEEHSVTEDPRNLQVSRLQPERRKLKRWERVCLSVCPCVRVSLCLCVCVITTVCSPTKHHRASAATIPHTVYCGFVFLWELNASIVHEGQRYSGNN